MIRILLPLAVMAALLFGPLLGQNEEIGGIAKTVTLTGGDYIGDTIKCWQSGEYSLDGDCEPEGGLKGTAIFAAFLVSGIAAALGVVGLLPLIGRLTSMVTVVAGLIVMLSVGYFALSMMGGGDAGETLQWGTYLAAGGGLLTLIAGLAGIRGQ